MHDLQLVLPLLSWYVPAAHNVHALDLESLEKEPEEHGICMGLRVVEKEPVVGCDRWNQTRVERERESRLRLNAGVCNHELRENDPLHGSGLALHLAQRQRTQSPGSCSGTFPGCTPRKLRYGTAHMCPYCRVEAESRRPGTQTPARKSCSCPC